jgi:hypothetical protein
MPGDETLSQRWTAQCMPDDAAGTFAHPQRVQPTVGVLHHQDRAVGDVGVCLIFGWRRMGLQGDAFVNNRLPARAGFAVRTPTVTVPMLLR